MKFNDAIPGALFLAIGIFAFFHAGTFTRFPGVPYGPDLFPRMIAVMMGGGGLILMVKGPRSANRAPWLELADWARQWRSYGLFFAVVAAMLFYIFFSAALGFLLTGFLMLTGLFLVTRGPAAILSSVALSFVVTAVIHLIFVEALRVPLPFGVIERWLI